MGKIRKLRAKTAAPKPSQAKDVPRPASPPIVQSIFNQLVPKDFDLQSVRSFKSMKNKFGIKKQIKKTDKVKLKKEVFKHKIDIIKETEDTRSVITSNNKNKKGKKNNPKMEVAKPEPDLFYSGNVNKTFEPDVEEEYVKLGHKIKGIKKKNQRQKQKNNDVQTLKALFKKVKK